MPNSIQNNIFPSSEPTEGLKKLMMENHMKSLEMNVGCNDEEYFETCIEFLKSGADVNTTILKDSLLHAVIREGNLDALSTFKHSPETLFSYFKQILAFNPDIEIKNSRGSTPFIFAAVAGNTKIMDELYKRGANVLVANEVGNTALMEYVEIRHQEIPYLMNLGCIENIHHQNKKGKSALMIAVENKNVPAVSLLLSYGANPYQKAKDGMDSFALSKYYFSKDITKILQDFVDKEELNKLIENKNLTPAKNKPKL